MTKTVFASLEQLQAIVAERQARKFVWPYEGTFDAAGRFVFNDRYDGFQELLIDGFSANAMVKVYDAINPKNKAIMETWIARHRGDFAAMFEFAMENTTTGAAPRRPAGPTTGSVRIV